MFVNYGQFDSMYVLTKKRKSSKVLPVETSKTYFTAVQLVQASKVFNLTLVVDNAKELLERKNFDIQVLAYTQMAVDKFTWHVSCDFLTADKLHCNEVQDGLSLKLASKPEVKETEDLYTLQVNCSDFELSLVLDN